VCLVPLTNAVSGTERVVADIARALHARQRPLALLTPPGDALDRYSQTFRPYTDTIARIHEVTGPRAVPKNFVRGVRLFRAIRPGIVHFHCPNYRWGLGMLLAARVAGVPRVVRTEHNPLMETPRGVVGLLLRLADQGVTAFTYVSRGNQARYEGRLPHRAGRGRVIANAIDPALFVPRDDPAARAATRTLFGLPQETRVAISVGSFGGRRSLVPIFQAMSKLLRDPATADVARQWRLLVVGSGGDDEMSAPAALGIQDVVHFAGQRADVHAILPHCDLYVSASHFEGMSIAMLEAWAAGVPVLAMQVDGVADIMGEETARQMMVPHEDVDAYARAWYAFMQGDPVRLEAHHAATLRVRQEFTLPVMQQAYLKMYDDIQGHGT
jgi:glycosyltransferase involved in cell wall biosynthesis